MIRATTSGVLNSYRTNLMQSFITQSTAMKNILKPRNFHSYADDTAAAPSSGPGPSWAPARASPTSLKAPGPLWAVWWTT